MNKNTLYIEPPLRDNESKPEVLITTSWIFRLGKTDARLMLKALGGRLTPDEIELAKTLGDKLALLRAESARDQLNGYLQAEQHVQNKIPR